MNKHGLRTLALASLLTMAVGSAMAGSTGPTDPVDGSAKTPPPILKKDTDGSSPGADGTSPGTKGMDPAPKTGTESGKGGMTNDQGMGGNGGGAEGGAGGKGGASGGG